MTPLKAINLSPLRALLLLSMLLTAMAGRSSAAEASVAQAASVSGDRIELPLSDPSHWVVDTTHLGTKQIRLSYSADEKVAVLTPTWSKDDLNSEDVAIRNVENGVLYVFQMVKRSDCTQSESLFEISVPQAYVDEGRLGLVFSIQGGKEDDYLFNGHAFTMKDFSGLKGGYKQVLLKASDFNEPDDKRRGIQRVGFTFQRNGSMISAPIKIRRISIDLNSSKILPPASEAVVANPASSYEFTYTTQADADRIQTRVSKESMDITKQVNATKGGLVLIPQWKAGQVPEGHTGNVYIGESLGAPHNFENFEIQYVVNIPRAYFDEGKMDIYLCIQAGETGYFRWSGAQRPLSSFADKAGTDVVLKLTQADVANGKKRNQIEFVGMQINRHGSLVTEPILLKRIFVKIAK